MESAGLGKVLVTGAAGFVGTHLAAVLAGLGAQVHGVGLGAPSADLPLASWAALDILDLETLERSLGRAQPDAVVHLAGQSSAAESFAQPVETFRSNVIGTWTLLEAVRRVVPRARVLVVGSGEAYGPQPEGAHASETLPFRPVSPYALSKAVADTLAEAHARARGLVVVRTRSFGHTGPGQSPRFIVPSVARQISAIERGEAEPILKVGNLDVVRDLCDVRDVARAYIALLRHGRALEAYNVCTGRPVRLADVVRDLASRARVAVRIEVDPARLRPADVPWLVGDPSAIRRDVGWQAEIPLERTLGDVLEEWRRHDALR